MLTLTNSFLLLGVIKSVPVLMKIAEEMQRWRRERVRTDGYTDTHTARCKPVS